MNTFRDVAAALVSSTAFLAGAADPGGPSCGWIALALDNDMPLTASPLGARGHPDVDLRTGNGVFL